MNVRTLFFAWALTLFGCAGEPPQPAPVVQRTLTPETPEQQAQKMHAVSVYSCVAHGNTQLECEVRAQILETCLATKNFAPCQNLPQMSKTTQPSRTECRWVFDNWECTER
jgi:hypothetical protein